jgi:hypothetical protein
MGRNNYYPCFFGQTLNKNNQKLKRPKLLLCMYFFNINNQFLKYQNRSNKKNIFIHFIVI